MNGAHILRHTGFLRLLVGTTATLLGDQFIVVVMPWLVLHLTHDSLALGIVMACVGLPRAALLMVAGALVDRYSQRGALIVSSLAASAALFLFGIQVLADAVNIQLVYVFAIIMGVTGSFSIPARMSILPRLVEPAQLQAANSMMMAASQGAVLLGPILAGLLGSTAKGMAIAFLVNGGCFLVAAWSAPRITPSISTKIEASEPLLASIVDSVRRLVGDTALRTLTCYWAIAALIASGPVQVGLPVLVQQQLGMGSAAFGMLISVMGVGQLIGALLCGLDWLKTTSLGVLICLVDMFAGQAMVGIGMSRLPMVSAALMFVLGVGVGFVQVSLYTWIQNRIPKHVLGRITSILTLVMTGISPLSAVLAGALTRYVSMQNLFVFGGILLSGFAMVSVLASRTIRRVQLVS
ncbi:MFS transporter [Dyella sp.]|uniref:MFS transporter n=1 Tax=Dyella sp. TaxID=1869338 RepID=UPI002B484625|nr:MFS transporter [Dyella sp.]HKT26545.1 MFS transporter [Dyella sp.]